MLLCPSGCVSTLIDTCLLERGIRLETNYSYATSKV